MFRSVLVAVTVLLGWLTACMGASHSLLSPIAKPDDPRAYLNEIFKGDLGSLKVSGDVTVKSETDLVVDVNMQIENDNGWKLIAEMQLSDQRCDYRDLQVEAAVKVGFPKEVTAAFKLACMLLESPACKGFDGTVSLSSPVSQSINLLPDDGSKLSDRVSVNISDVADPSLKPVLDFFGVDMSFEIIEPRFMLAGMNFSMGMSATVMDPDVATACDSELLRKSLGQLSEDLCVKPVLSVSNVNVGKEIKKWISESGESSSWITSDGVFVVGESSLSCFVEPADFKFKVSRNDITKALTSDEWRKALTAAVNSRLPEGYKVSDSAFSKMDISVDGDGNLIVEGKVYAGAAKDPSALIKAVSDYLSSNGGKLDVGDDKDPVSISIEDDARSSGKCNQDLRRVQAGACDPSEVPETVYVDPPMESPSPQTSGFGPDPSEKRKKGKGRGRGFLGTPGIILITISATLVTVFTVMYAIKRSRALVNERVYGNSNLELDNVVTGAVVINTSTSPSSSDAGWKKLSENP